MYFFGDIHIKETATSQEIQHIFLNAFLMWKLKVTVQDPI